MMVLKVFQYKSWDLIAGLFLRDELKLDGLANAIENNQSFSSENLEVKKDELGPKIIIKAMDEDGIINAAKQLTKVYKQNPNLKSKIYSGLKLEEDTDKLLTAYLASESELPTPEIDGERSFGYNLIADRILYKLREIDRKVNKGITIEIKRSNEENDKNYTFLDSIKKHKKAILTVITASALGSFIVYPSLIKGRILFDPYLTINHIAQTIQSINPILLNNLISDNLRYAAYTIPAFKIEDEDSQKKKSRKIKFLKYGIPIALASWFSLDLLNTHLTLPIPIEIWPKYVPLTTIKIPGPINSIEAYIYSTSTGLEWNKSVDLALLTNIFYNLGQLISGKEADISKVIRYINQAKEIIPPDIRIYYTNQDFNQIGYNLGRGLLEGGINSDVEKVLKILNNKEKWNRWWIVRDIYRSGMLGYKFLNEDWDKDGLTNLTEITQGTNPLNYLEITPNNLSERYAIYVEWIGGSDFRLNVMERLCKIFKRNGYNDKNTILVALSTDEEEWGKLELFPIKLDYMGQIGDTLRRETIDKIFNYMKNLPSDENDTVFIYISAHGNPREIAIGNPSPNFYDFANVIKEMKYGELIFALNSCHSGAFAKNLYNLLEDSNILFIPAQDETYDVNTPITPFLEYLDEGMSVEEAFNKFASYESKMSEGRNNPLMFTRREEPFINFLVYIKRE